MGAFNDTDRRPATRRSACGLLLAATCALALIAAMPVTPGRAAGQPASAPSCRDPAFTGRASVEGQEDTPRYTAKEIEALGKRGLAYKRRNGTYSFPIVDRRDLLNAIKAWGRAAPSEAAAVKAFIKRRAVLLKLDNLLPASWLPPAPVGASA